jgi:hypothetical protein
MAARILKNAAEGVTVVDKWRFSQLKKVSARRIEVVTALKVRGTEIVPPPASADINSRGRRAYLFTVRVKRL